MRTSTSFLLTICVAFFLCTFVSGQEPVTVTKSQNSPRPMAQPAISSATASPSAAILSSSERIAVACKVRSSTKTIPAR
jgi:hypothetical protein